MDLAQLASGILVMAAIALWIEALLLWIALRSHASSQQTDLPLRKRRVAAPNLLETNLMGHVETPAGRTSGTASLAPRGFDRHPN